MAVIDIFNPQVSVVSHDMAGKTVLIYGTNRTGKTKQLTKLPKPYYLPFEAGLNGIPGVPFLPIQTWSDFVKINRQLTNPDNLKKAKDLYQTIILDEAESSGMLCSDFVCEKFQVNRINDGNGGYGLWKEYSNEYRKQIRLLTSVGYTVAFIAHEGTRDFTDENGEEYSKIYPKGDKRIIDPICDLVDIIGYARPNGLDEEGNEINSSLFMKNTLQYHAGTRFDYMPSVLKEFTAENLQQAIADAVKKQEETEGIKSVSYAEQTSTYKTVNLSFEGIVEKIKGYALKMHEEGKAEDYKDIVENHLGAGGSVAEAKKTQKQQLELILDDLENR